MIGSRDLHDPGLWFKRLGRNDFDEAENVTITADSFTRPTYNNTRYTVRHHFRIPAAHFGRCVRCRHDHAQRNAERHDAGFTSRLLLRRQPLRALRLKLQQKNIAAGDNGTVVDLYYNRNSYGVSYYHTLNTPAGASALPAGASYRF